MMTFHQVETIISRLDEICRALRAASVRSAHAAPADGPFETILKRLSHMSETFSSEFALLKADVAEQNTVIRSATTAFAGLAAALLAAENKAVASGATPEQIAGVTSLRTDLESNTALLAAAIPQNVPGADGSTTKFPAPASGGVVTENGSMAQPQALPDTAAQPTSPVPVLTPVDPTTPPIVQTAPDLPGAPLTV